MVNRSKNKPHIRELLEGFRGSFEDFISKHSAMIPLNIQISVHSLVSHIDATHFVIRERLLPLSATYKNRYWERMIRYAASKNMMNISPLTSYVERSYLLPKECLIRLGTLYGGWIIPANSELNSNSVCYLAGAGEDISFDCALVSRYHCKTKIIDPTPRAIEHFRQLEKAVSEGRRFPINNSDSQFYDISASDLEHLSYLSVGLSDQDEELRFYLPANPSHVSCSTINIQQTDQYLTAQCHRLSTLMSQDGDKQIDLLKMDIEGAEYAVIDDMVSSNLLPRILLIEFDEAHTPQDHHAESRIRERIHTLEQAGMRCVAIEGTNATFIRES